VQGAFARAAHTLQGTRRIHRHTGTPMEPRACVAALDTALGYLTLWTSTQTPHMLRTVIAQTLKMHEEEVRVIQPNVGGAFGIKIATHPEDPLVCLLAKLTGKPVKWIEERSEHLQAAGRARAQVHHYEVAFENDGTVIGFKDRIAADNGVVTAICGWGMPFVTTFTLPACYKILNCETDLSIVVTNKGSLNAYRGFGKECSSFVMDRVMDAVARRLNMDRAEVRRKNFISPGEFPYEQISGMRADSGNYAGALSIALEKIGCADFHKQQQEARKQGRYLGLGISFELTPEGGSFLIALLQASIDTRTLLVGFLRDYSGLTGTYVGCLTGNCGACTVFMDGLTVKSCTILAADTEGSDVMTIEGLTPPGEEKLYPLQQSFVDHHALQCGYCTPGMVLSAYKLLQDYPNPDEPMIRHNIAGNLCRCTGYQHIIEAIKAVVSK
jgi:carbon-monoxide dehydrogenase large subunit